MMRKWISLLLVYLIGFYPTAAFALPKDGQVVAGSGTIGTTSPGHMVINQSSSQMITNWQGFSIGSAESVTFNQPGAQATSLNRVIGTDPSRILGKMTANGQVFLSNPSGILFGPGAVVNAHGLVATTLGISNQDFLDRNYNFTQDPTQPLASVINKGLIQTSGFTGLLAPAVSNEGTIIANLGSVALGSGEAATLDFTGDGLIKFAITQEVTGEVRDTEGNVIQDRVHNSGNIQANGGQVMLTARDAGNVIRNVINNTGVIEARSVVEKNGRIFLMGGENGVVRNTGTLDVSGKNPGETGGQVVVLGEKVGMFDQAKVDASGSAGGGEILLGGEQLGAIAVEGEANTDFLYIHDDAEINADARDNGDGGRIITWANNTNRVFGQIYARGGAQSGNGGFVEISGGQYFEIGNIPDVTAVNGQAGHWLIDPGNDLSIVAGGGNTNINATNPFATTNDAASLGWNLIKSFLTGGATVTVQTTASGTASENGDINVNTDLDYDGTGVGNTLILTALGKITFNNKIFDGSGFDDILDLQLNAQNGVDFQSSGNVVTGSFLANSGSTSGANFTIGSTADLTIKNISTTFSSSVRAYDFVIDGTLTYEGSGNVFLDFENFGSTEFGIGTTNCQTTFCSALIDNTELNNIFSANQNVLFLGNSKMFIKDVALANVDQMKGIQLNPTTSDVEFEAGTGSNFKDLFINMSNATGDDILVNSDITTTGVFSSTLSSNFNVAPGNTVDTSGNSLFIFTGDITLGGNLDSGAGTTEISANAGGDMNLGAGGAGLNMTNAELANITAGTLHLGDSSKTNQDVFIDGVTDASFNNIANFLFINAGNDIVFQNNPSTFRFLTATAKEAVGVEQNVSSTLQDLTLNSDFDGDGNGLLDIDNGITLASNAVLRLNGGSAGINMQGGSTLNANNSVDLQTNTTLGGFTTINSDLDDNGTGTFKIGSGATVNSSGGNFNIILTAADVQLDGNVNTGTGVFNVFASNNRTSGLGTFGANLSVDGGELSRITAGKFELGSGLTNTVTVNNVTAAQTANITEVKLNSANQVIFGPGGATFKKLTANGNDGVSIAGNVTTTADALFIEADANADNTGLLTLANGVTLDSADVLVLDAQATGTGIVANGSATLRAKTGLTIDDNMSAGGVLTLNADTGTPGDGQLDIIGTLTTNNNNLLIHADDLNLVGDINAGTGNVFISVSDTEDLNVGAPGASMNIEDVELDSIFANKLSFFAQGTVNVEDVTLSTVNQLILNTPGEIKFITDPSFVTSLEANAGGNIIFQKNLTSTGALSFKADVDGNGTGNIVFGSGVTIDSGGSNVAITANDYQNASTFTLNAGAGDVRINVSDGGPIGIGNATCPSGCGMQISKTELSNIFARDLTIGNFNAGNIFVNSVTPLNVANISRNTILNSGKNITFVGGASGFKGLELNAITDINILTDVTTTQFNFTAVADYENNSIGQFNLPEGVSVNSAGNINVKAAQINAEGDFNALGNVKLLETFPTPEAGAFNSGTQSTFLTKFLKNAAGGCS